ncbi:MAG: sulfur carrier protein ThiS [Rikenellaceae bacterium]
MKVFLNQNELTIDESTTLQELITNQGIKPEGVAVAINNRIITRSEWPSTMMDEGAKVVVIQATYGG